MMSDRLRFTLLVAVAALWVWSNSAHAVQLSADNQGQYLILPLTVANAEFDTLLQINNEFPYMRTGPELGRAVKVRMLDRQGELAVTGNLYLRENESWAAAMFPDGDVTRLQWNSTACFLVEDDEGTVVPTTSLEFDHQVGSVEMVEMGVVFDAAVLGYMYDEDCHLIADLWMDPDWNSNPDAVLVPPEGGLRASASIISVAQGTMYSLTASALQNFSIIGQHGTPGGHLPDLTSANDSGTPQGETQSVVCHENGCVAEVWGDPFDAVRAVLTAQLARADILVTDSIGARTEWAITFPTFAYEVGDGEFIDATMLTFDRSGEEFDYGAVVPIPPPPLDFPDRSPFMSFESAVNFIDFTVTGADHGNTQPTAILGVEHLVQFPSLNGQIPPSGQAFVGFESYGARLVNNSGNRYHGWPVLVTVLQQYTNGTLPGDSGPVLANYGNAFPGSLTRRVEN